MKATFKQYTPEELFINLELPDTLEADSPTEIPTSGFRPTGNAFLDAFVQNLHHCGIHSGNYHAKKLGIKTNDLFTTVLTLTGMNYSDFTERYVLLMANELFKHRRRNHQQIAKRLGFGSYSGFYRFMIRKGMGKPSWV